MISTLNESSLHRTLKALYALEDGSVMEAACDGHIYDILDKNGSVTEIQTGSLSKLLPKLRDALGRGRKCTVVYPLIVKKTIELHDEDGACISSRKSPKTASIYSLFRELTGLRTVLLQTGFSLEVLEVRATEIRRRTPAPVQSQNGRRRFRRNWLKTDKRLDEIIRKRTFSDAKDYVSLLPGSIPPEFSARMLADALSQDKELPASAAQHAPLAIWVLSRMGILEQTRTESRSRLYKIAGSHVPAERYGTFEAVRTEQR
ncbi:MAG: hypothetical protein K2H09_00840 [Treponemataceae bacterium]|nr:hypothetical protein [Treponemataceae bacterium]